MTKYAVTWVDNNKVYVIVGYSHDEAVRQVRVLLALGKVAGFHTL